MKKIALCGLLAFAVGCDGFQSATQFDHLSAVSEGIKMGVSDKPYCEVDLVDYELDTHLLAFEITDKNNIGFGFNIASGFINAIGLNVSTEKGKMMAAMHLREALRPIETIVDVTGIGESSSTDFNIKLDAARLSADLGYFRQTPLYKLTEKTIAGTLKNLKAELSTIETDWSTRVVHIYPTTAELIIPAGSVAGIRVGDKFKIFNVDYTWEADPCTSALLFRRKQTAQPLAILQVTQLEKNASLLSVVERFSDENIEEGAIVEVSSLPFAGKEKSRSPLARAVRLSSFKSEKLSIADGKSVDLSLFLEEQTSVLLNSYGFYPRK